MVLLAAEDEGARNEDVEIEVVGLDASARGDLKYFFEKSYYTGN